MKKLLLLLLTLSFIGTAYSHSGRTDAYGGHIDFSNGTYHYHNSGSSSSGSYSGNCRCPYDTASDGSRCGARSAWSRSGGASPKCYVSSIQNAVDLADTPGAGMMYNARGIGRREGEAYEALGTLIESLFNSFGN